MSDTVLEQIDRAIERSIPNLTKDLKRLIAINSVKGEPLPDAPFGPGPKKVLDTLLEMGKTEGFHTTDYHVGVVSLALKEGQPDLGIWLHGDVVPVGDGWLWPPFEATVHKGCVIGRGATDNKGQLCAIYHLLKIFKDLEVPLNYNGALYVGSDEESGQRDLCGIPGNTDAKGFFHVCTPPRLSLVPDSGFPVGIGGNGGITAVLRGKNRLQELTLTAGLPNTPGLATAVIGKEIITTQSAPQHAAHPKAGGNMITMLMDRLLERSDISETDRPVLEFFRHLSLDIDGAFCGICVQTKIMKPLTLSTLRIETRDGFPEMTINIRHPIEITADEIAKQLANIAEAYGVELANLQSTRKPYLSEVSESVVSRLNAIANEVTGENKPPYALSGGTYAHVLPNALVYGMNGCKKPEDFPVGHGGAHGMDELVSLERLERAMKIYARALLALNDLDW